MVYSKRAQEELHGTYSEPKPRLKLEWGAVGYVAFLLLFIYTVWIEISPHIALIGTIAGVGIAGIIGLFVGALLLIGSLVIWPLSIILAIVGGFAFGGVGAAIGVGISGAIGLILAKFSN